MTHEFLQIVESYKKSKNKNIRTVLATIVHVDGSSYRKEGTRMLIDETQKLTGALSGGCIENEVLKQSVSVFNTNCPKVFKYDGRFRLGCEGSIYILLEVFSPTFELVEEIESSIRNRESFKVKCNYVKDELSLLGLGTIFEFKTYLVQQSFLENNIMTFEQKIEPLNRLCIFGTEHDSVKLCELAVFLGWEVIIIGTENSNKSKNNYPLAKMVVNSTIEDLDQTLFRNNTAIVIMSHVYSKDFKFLLHVLLSNAIYIGVLGPIHRKEKLLNDLIEYNWEFDENILDKIHGPVGLAIGSITPEEIALSIMAEIVSVLNLNKSKKAILV